MSVWIAERELAGTAVDMRELDYAMSFGFWL